MIVSDALKELYIPLHSESMSCWRNAPTGETTPRQTQKRSIRLRARRGDGIALREKAPLPHSRLRLRRKRHSQSSIEKRIDGVFGSRLDYRSTRSENQYTDEIWQFRLC